MTRPRFDYDEEELGRLLAALPPAPPGWLESAAVLPGMRRDAERIVALAEADQRFRAEATANLEIALREAGYEPSPTLLAAVRARLERR